MGEFLKWQLYDALKNTLLVNIVPFMMDPFGNSISFYMDALETEVEVVYPALTGSNLSVSKAKRQIQDAHLKAWENQEA